MVQNLETGENEQKSIKRKMPLVKRGNECY
jgi:hypothetical protein